MRIIISPAKKMHADTDSLLPESLPLFLAESEELLRCLQGMDDPQLKTLWRCNDTIADLNARRVRTMRLRENLTPAILAYEGIQYRYMAPGVFENAQFAYIGEHLRILSGFYGLLRPFDGVTPYRLEMQAKLAVGGCKDLYAFWKDKLARQLCGETDFILNLASREYSKAISAYLPKGSWFLTCVFGEREGGRVVEKGTLCKMARGEMVRWLAENRVAEPEEIKAFDRLSYTYSKEQSTKDRFVFLKGGKEHAGSRPKSARFYAARSGGEGRFAF